MSVLIKKIALVVTIILSLSVAAQTVSLPIPEKMTFCGKTIDLRRYDMRERLDREQLSFMYMHSSSIQLLKRANRYFPIIESILERNGLPDDLKYLCAIESNLDPHAYSPAKAAGLWQLMPATARQYGLEVNDEVDERYHVEKATVAACQYLKDAYKKYGDWPTTCASYNAGQGRISSEQTKQQVTSSFDMYLVSETSRYVFRILAAKCFFSNPADFGFCLKKEHFYHTVRTKDVTVNTTVSDWATWANEYGITYAQLKDFNPWLRARELKNPQGKLYTLKIPLQEDLLFDAKKITIHHKNWAE